MKLADRLLADEGRHYVPGIQMLVRLPLEQARRDRAAGLRIGTYISGYPGSPLGGYDLALDRQKSLLEAHGVQHVPGGNEELAMASLTGTQMIDDYPHSQWDGVTAIWYGKGPGLDRSGDALKHGNFAGTSRHGAVVVLSGDDHEAKSSTMPYQEEYSFAAAGVPILHPGAVAEFRSLGLHAVAMSRYSGCWVGMKLTNPLCDAGETVDLGVPVTTIVPELLIDGIPFHKRADFTFFPGKNIDIERHLYYERHRAVVAYARANGLDQVVRSAPGDRIGIITAGKCHADVLQALHNLRVDDGALAEAGVRILKLALTYPIDADLVREFADGLEEVVVVEEKRGFLESQVKEALQELGQPIRVVGKLDESGRPLFPVHGGFDTDLVTEKLAARLAPVLPRVAEAPRLRELMTIAQRDYKESNTRRSPNFCSGCPHSTSTVLAPGQVAWGAPGCACFNTVIEQPERHIDTMTHYGGEGLPWVGLSRFTDRTHLVQHLGDGSLYHSSYLNIRWAVATSTNITFKILFNGYVSNTGAQEAPGNRGIPALTRSLEAEGVARIVIATKKPESYSDVDLAPGVEVRHARELVSASEELQEVPGVTVLIYDETCANERRRRQKRGQLPMPDRYVLINEDVCENCGDCGVKSNCMSLQKTATEFGPKTRIHESSCNQDYSCVAGDCPSFVTVVTAPGTGYRKQDPPMLETGDLDAPVVPRLERPFSVYIPGVGGTGVLTLNAMLSVAAMLDGHEVRSYDQTGAAQKWGPVLSTLTLAPAGAPAFTNKVGHGEADLYLALDEVGAAVPQNLDRCSPTRTSAVVNVDLFPTGEMVRDVDLHVDTAALRQAIVGVCRPGSTVEVSARSIAERLFGDYMLTNVIALGAATQAGRLPITPESIERAIELNGVGVARNIQAFRYGRLWVQDRDRILAITEPRRRTAAEEREHRLAALPRRQRAGYAAMLDCGAHLDEESRRLLAVRVAELIDYQDRAYAEEYLESVLRVAASDPNGPDQEPELTHAVIRNLYRVMAYKDEYEVARLYLRDTFAQRVAETFEAPVQVRYNLQPPLFRTLGRATKVQFGPSFRLAFAVLRTMRPVRGTALDPFGRQASRREERELLAWYRQLLDTGLEHLRPLTYRTVVELASLPSDIRGFEAVKSANAHKVRIRADELVARLRRPSLPLLSTGP